VKQQYLPDEVGEKIFYHPTQQGREKKLAEYLSFIKKIKEND
jgi:putative ATPase